MTRDKQRSRLYRAERQCGLQVEKSKLEPMTIGECQKFVNKVLERKAVKDIKHLGKFHPVLNQGILVEAGKGGGYATYRYGRRIISLGVWARQPFILLHEIAHHLAPSYVNHGPEFASIFLKLTRQVLGKEAEEKLLASYALNGVQVIGKNGKPRKARCPKSQKAWLEETKWLIQSRKNLERGLVEVSNDE